MGSFVLFPPVGVPWKRKLRLTAEKSELSRFSLKTFIVDFFLETVREVLQILLGDSNYLPSYFRTSFIDLDQISVTEALQKHA